MEEYDIVDAFNYNTYRPPLHRPILSQCLKNHRFNLALDVGCGVGNSSLGLTHFCKRVIGYDISKAMLKKAIKHKKKIIFLLNQILNMIYYASLVL